MNQNQTRIVPQNMRHSGAGFTAAALCVVAAIFLAASPAASAATTVLLDQNGTNPGFWDGVTTPINVDVTASVTWTTDPTGVAQPTAGAVGDNFQIGGSASDFNGAAITFSTLAATLTGTNFSVVSTNAQVTWASSGNAHFNTANTFVSVAAGSTLTWTSTANNNGFNFNSKTTTFTGGGIMIFTDAFCANGNAVNTMNMPGGAIMLNQTATSNFGGAAGGAFTLTAGTLQFGSATALANAFGDFISGNVFTIGTNNPIIDNTSGSAGTIKLGSGATPGKYTFGGNFTFTGSSDLSLSNNAVTLTGNRQITISAGTLTIGGPIAGTNFGLTKVGPGTLKLSGANTYTGSTIVNAGTLALSGAASIASSSNVVMAANTILDMSGLTIPYSTTNNLALTNVTVTLTIPSSLASPLSVGNLTLGGATNVINVTQVPLLTGYPTTFHLVSYSNLNGAFNVGITLPASSDPFIFTQSNNPVNKSIDLTLLGGPTPVRAITWVGTDPNSPGSWDAAGSLNWKLTNGTLTGYQQAPNGDLCTFDDSATGTPVVQIAQPLNPGSVTVTNNSVPYNFIGSSLSDSSVSLTLLKQGSGSLLLQENGDNFSGGITINGGTVIVDNDSSGITGGVNISAGATLQLGTNDTVGFLPSGTITDNGTLNFDHSDDITVLSPIAGNGLVTQFSSDILTLSGISSGNWSIIVTNGTLQAANNTALGTLPGGTVTITNGGTFDCGANISANNAANFGAKQFNIAGTGVGGNGVLINSASTTQEDAFENIVLTANATIGGSLSSLLGNDQYRYDLRGGPALLNLTNFTLTKISLNHVAMVSAHVTSGNIVVNAGILSFESTPSFDASAGTILVNPGAFVGQFKDTLGSFTRAIILNGGGTTNLSGAASTSFVDAPILLTADSSLGSPAGTQFYDGAISDGGLGFGLSNYGNGTNLLAGTNTYLGATLVAGGVLGLTNNGSISDSSVVIVTNSATFDISGSSIPFSLPTNTLVLGDDSNGLGTFILGNTTAVVSNLSIINAALTMSVFNANVPCISATNLNLGDGTATVINITGFPPVLPAQFPLIKYANVAGSFNLFLGTFPSGYSLFLSNNVANHSIDAVITATPAGLWNGGSLSDNNWSDPANWNGTALSGNDPLVFTGTNRLNSFNDIDPNAFTETAQSINFVGGSGAFTLSGSPILLSGNIVNSSTNVQTIDLGMTFNNNLTLNGVSNTLVIGGGFTNAGTGNLTNTLIGTGVLSNNLAITTTTVTNTYLVNAPNANWTLLNNPSSTPVTNALCLLVNSGTFVFGSAASAPNLTSTTVNGQPSDHVVGAAGLATFTMSNGVFTTAARFNTGTAGGATGVVNQVGGIFNMGSQFQGANGATNAFSFVNLSGGTMNIGSAANPASPFYVASRGPGVLNMSGTAALNCGTLDVSRAINSGIPGTVNLNGGTITCARVGTATANATATSTGDTAAFNFNGGTLKAATNSATWYQGATVSPAVPIVSTVKSNGAIVDDGGFAVSILEPLIHDSTGPATDGGFTKLGVGTVTLGMANTYTGPTAVMAGTLSVTGSLGTNTVTIATNATLAGTGSILGNVTVNGTLSPAGSNVVGILTTAGSLALAGTNNMDLSKVGSTLTNDVVTGSTNLHYGGVLQLPLTTNSTAALAAGDTFRLFTATHYSGAFTSIVPATPGPGLGWNTSSLITNGILSVFSTALPARLGAITISAGTNLIINATGGAQGGSFRVLASSTPNAPLHTWTQVGSGNYNSDGNLANFTVTGAVNPADTAKYYVLVSP